MEFSQSVQSRQRFIPLTSRRRQFRSAFDPMHGHNLALEHYSSMTAEPVALTDGSEQTPYAPVPNAPSVAMRVNSQQNAIRPAARPNPIERKRRPVGVRRVR